MLRVGPDLAGDDSINNTRRIAIAMKKLLMFVLFIFSGCVAHHGQPDFDHRITIPRQFQYGRVYSIAESYAELYVTAYEVGWKQRLDEYIKDSSQNACKFPATAYGREASIEGCYQGYRDAEAYIQKNVRRYGKERVLEYLRKRWLGLEEGNGH